MEIRENATASEVLEKARECWTSYYCDLQHSQPIRSLLWDAKATLLGKLTWGAGSVINLFPNTCYEAEDFRCWRASVADAWNDDWYNVGADLYEALAKAQVEPIDVRSTEHEPTVTATP
jgi:hypothetical protein